MASNKIFALIRPNSLIDENYADYEYLIRWIGRDGSDYQYMFYDAEIENKIDNDLINSNDEDRIESLIDREGRTITLKGDNFSKNDLTVIGEMLANKYVTRLKKDGTTERYAPDRNSYSYELKRGRYDIRFTLHMSDLTAWK